MGHGHNYPAFVLNFITSCFLKHSSVFFDQLTRWFSVSHATLCFSVYFLHRIASKETNNRSEDQGMLNSRILFKRSMNKLVKHNVMEEENHDVDYGDSMLMNEDNAMEDLSKKARKHRPYSKTGPPLMFHDGKHVEDQELINWKKNFHFASFPLFDFGNWIPFVMSRWPCLGTGCGLPQVAFKNSKGNAIINLLRTVYFLVHSAIFESFVCCEQDGKRFSILRTVS